MTAVSQEQTWPQADSQHNFCGTVFQFVDQIPEYKYHDNRGNSHDLDSASSSSSAVYSLSDMSLSSSSSGSVKDSTGAPGFDVSHKTSSDVMFLPPTKSRHDKFAEIPACGNETTSLPTYFSDSGSLNSACFSDNDERNYGVGSSLICQSSALHSQMSGTPTFDVDGMREKLEAQKEYLLGSFKRQTCLPQALMTQPRYPRVEKPSSLKMKEKLHKVGRAAQRFLNTRIFRRHPAVQRCEIQLQGFDDNVERLILVLCQRRNVSETVHMSFPTFFETNRVTVPQFLLPVKSGEIMTVSVYGVTSQTSGQFPGFSEVLVSGVCTVQSDTALLTLTGKLELQPHRPCHSMTGHNKGVQSCGSSMMVKHRGSDNYTFLTLPKPISKDFTELCVLQTAEPFCECFLLSTSTCDQPASFQAYLSPGTYHAVCSYRLTHAPTSGTYSVASATPTVFFKAYMDKTGVAEKLGAAAELVQDGVGSGPQLLPSLQLLKPPGFDLEALMKTLQAAQAGKGSTEKPTDTALGTTEEGLHFCAWNTKAGMTDYHHMTVSATTKSRFATVNVGTSMANPRLPTGNRECIPLPSLSMFNPSTQLYFADFWSYYDKYYVILVLCAKGSPCQKVCKQHLCKLDPYNNPFLFRKRCFDPEPSIAVYTSSSVNVEVIYSNSAEILQLISVCSENVYFCKVQMADK